MATTVPVEAAVGSADTAKSAVTISVQAIPSDSQRDRLKTGEVLLEQQPLFSPNGRYRFVIEGGCMNLYEGEKVIWTSKTRSKDRCKLAMQEDDNLFLNQEREKGYDMWDSNTRYRPSGGNANFIIRDSGVAVIESDEGVLWATDKSVVPPYFPKYQPCPADAHQLGWGQFATVGQLITSPNGQFSTFLREDGALCIRRNASGAIVWVKNPGSGSKAARIIVTYNCKLVVYDANNMEIWSHGEFRHSVRYTTELKILDNGKLKMERSLPENGGMTTILWEGHSFLIEPGSAIEAEQVIAIDQTLSSGDYELGFNTYGNLFVRNKKDNSRTYYYTTHRYWEGALILKVTRDGLFEFFDGTGACRARSRNSHDGDYWRFPATKLSLAPDGRVTLNNHSKDRWDSNTEILKGPEPKMPPEMCVGFCLYPGKPLLPGQRIMSPNGDFFFINQTDGNVIVKFRAEEKPRWTAEGWPRKDPEPGNLFLHENGRLVKYLKDGKTVQWHNRVERGGGDAKVVMQNDGNLVMYLDEMPFWSIKE